MRDMVFAVLAFFGLVRESKSELAKFTGLFSALLNAGLPVLHSLRTICSDMKEGALKRALSAVINDVETGLTLSEAMSKHPKIFNRLVINMVRAGEAGGALEIVLARLAEYLKTPGQNQLARTLRTLAVLISSGVPILEAISIVKGMYEEYQGLYQQVYDSIREGDTIASPLQQSGIIPNCIVNLVDLGEETGDLDTALFVAADVLEQGLLS